MNIHANAKSCVRSRLLLVQRIDEHGWPLIEAAEAAGISGRTASKWLARYRTEGEAGLRDRSSAPRRTPRKTPPDRESAIRALRKVRFTAAEIAEILGMALSTVSLVLKRIGLGRLSRLDPIEPPNRYEMSRPGELVHVDVKKLGRISKHGAGHRVLGHGQRQSQRVQETIDGRQRRTTGWEFVHVCVDDATRLAYAEVLEDEKGETAVKFFGRAIAWFESMGVTVERVLTDNGACYKSLAHKRFCAQRNIKHSRTRPYRPRTNGKAERFIKTMTERWAYGAIFGSSNERTAALPGWLLHYNTRRKHGGLSHKTPEARLDELNNLVGNYS